MAIDNVLVSDAVVEALFVCDLMKCKGGCCEDGDAGAPLEKEELQILNDIYETIKPYLTEEGIRWIEKHGRYTFDRDFGWQYRFFLYHEAPLPFPGRYKILPRTVG